MFMYVYAYKMGIFWVPVYSLYVCRQIPEYIYPAKMKLINKIKIPT